MGQCKEDAKFDRRSDLPCKLTQTHSIRMVTCPPQQLVRPNSAHWLRGALCIQCTLHAAPAT